VQVTGYMKLISYLLLVPRFGENAWKYIFVLPVLCLIRLGFEEFHVTNIYFKNFRKFCLSIIIY